MIYKPALILLLLIVLPAMVKAVSISEIMYDLDGSDSKREWLEVVNDGSESLSLEGWSIRIGDSSSKSALRFETGIGTVGSAVLQPAEYLIIADSPIDFLTDHPDYNGKIADSVVAFPNYSTTRTEAIPIRLYDSAGEERVVAYYLPVKEHTPGRSLGLVGSEWVASSEAGGTPGYRSSLGLPTPMLTTIRVVEIMSNPEGADSDAEWLVVENYGPQSIDLAGWYVADKPTASGATHKQLFESVSLLPQATHRLVLSDSFLNNVDEELSLYGSDGQLVETVLLVGSAGEGVPYIRTAGGWQWRSPMSPSLSPPTVSSTPSVKVTTLPKILPTPSLEKKAIPTPSARESTRLSSVKSPSPKSVTTKKATPSLKLPTGLTEVAGVRQDPPTIALSPLAQIAITIGLILISLGVISYRYRLHSRLFEWVRYVILKKK